MTDLMGEHPHLPLAGVTAVTLEHAVAAPLATRHLADLGARVLKIERPGTGDFARSYDRAVSGESSYFVWLNRGKESVALNLKHDDDLRLLHRIVARADVFVQNLIPGAVERLGLDAAALRDRHPRLIHCSISGYGAGGPFGTRKAYDLLIQCETGLVQATGVPDAPAKAGISVADIATGMYAFSGILAALYERERHDDGTTLTVCLLDALSEWMQQPAYQAASHGGVTRRTGARHASIAPYGPYQTGDGATVFLAVQNDREWDVFCRAVLGREELSRDPRFVDNPERIAHDDQLTAIIESSFATRPSDRILELLNRCGIACAMSNPPGRLFDHPQLVARDRWRPVQTPGGPVSALLPPVEIAGGEPLMGPVPRLGQHTDSVRREFEDRGQVTSHAPQREDGE